LRLVLVHRVLLASCDALFYLVGEETGLLLGEVGFAFEDYEETPVAGVFELGVADGDVVLDCRRECGFEVCGFLEGGEDGVVDLVADGVAEEAGTEEFAE
jgi:hypothetical protein